MNIADYALIILASRLLRCQIAWDSMLDALVNSRQRRILKLLSLLTEAKGHVPHREDWPPAPPRHGEYDFKGLDLSGIRPINIKD